MDKINVSSGAPEKKARRLSNLSEDHFVFYKKNINSVEGFIQGTKFPEEDARRYIAFSLAGMDAKNLSDEAAEFGSKFIWWNDEEIEYGSVKHHNLIERAIRAKFEQNPGAMEALVSTKGKEITHELGEIENPNTSLPKKIFCEILTRIREEKLKEIKEDQEGKKHGI
ncbi:hypothetical protein GQ568_02775 [Patescibacteria group bacterium]|nr:hypothetical protein [Patescibacteria group bacterium]